MKITKQRFGTLSDGTKVTLFTIHNGKMSFSVTDYGCTITSIVLEDSAGKKTDIVLGYSTLDGYIDGSVFFGATVGRYANRIGKASFILNGKKYQLDKNDGMNTLHGGFVSYNKMMWNAKTFCGKKQAGVKFTRISPDGEQGFPGNLKLEVIYALDENDNLWCRYNAVTDKATPINITNHSYFNLAGKGSVLDHVLKLNCPFLLDVDAKLIPTGAIIPVKDTPYDFQGEKKIGNDIKSVGKGYDNCFITTLYEHNSQTCGLPLSDEKLVRVAEVTEPESGRVLTVDSNMEGVQLYTANWIAGVHGKNGCVYSEHEALCLETQCFPDTPNKKDFPGCILEPGEKYHAVTVYGFKY
jgi:aldose 1-epimerase